MDLDGLLARGRGAGALAVLERGPAARESVLRHVLADPRWDRQIESRDEYYAGLLLALGADVGPLVAALAGRPRDESWLIEGVLMQLAIRDHLGALAALVAMVRRDGEDELLREFEGYVGPERARELAALAGRHYLPNTVEGPHERRDPVEPLVGIDSLVALVRGEERDASTRERIGAARRLGKLDQPGLIDEAAAFLHAQIGRDPAAVRATSSQRRVWMVYLESLPAVRMLPYAREWFELPRPLSRVGETILARHAEPCDRPQLVHACALAWRERDMYRICSALEALAHVATPAMLPLLLEVHDGIEYSWARERALAALFELREHPDAHARLVEGLWDCEASTREIACEGVRVESASARLHELAGDPWQDHDVRLAAREALEKV